MTAARLAAPALGHDVLPFHQCVNRALNLVLIDQQQVGNVALDDGP